MNNVIYVTCGHNETKEMILNHQEANLMILSIPFSDPIAEDPMLQASSVKALKNGCSVHHIFQMMEEVQKENHVPFIIRTYANVIFSYGTSRFIEACGRLHIQGILVPDLPFEEKEEFEPECIKHHVHLISTISTTSKNRIETIAKEAKGYLYVSSRKNESIDSTLKSIQAYTNVPCIVDANIQYLL